MHKNHPRNREYHKGRERGVPDIARYAWARHRKREHTALLAKQLGISKAAVSKWTHIPEDRLDKVSEILGIPRALLRPDLPDMWSIPSVHDYLKETT